MIRPESARAGAVAWGEFVEVRFLREYRKARSLQLLRPVVEKLREGLGVPYPLAHFEPFVGPGLELTLEAQRLAAELLRTISR